MDNLSEIYEDVDIKIWANEIRFIKIRELEDIIREKGNAIKNTDFETEDYMSSRRMHLLNDISRLTRKLSWIKNDYIPCIA